MAQRAPLQGGWPRYSLVLMHDSQPLRGRATHRMVDTARVADPTQVARRATSPAPMHTFPKLEATARSVRTHRGGGTQVAAVERSTSVATASSASGQCRADRPGSAFAGVDLRSVASEDW